MPRWLGVVAILAAFVVGVLSAHGCVDDRKKVAAQIFFCNPNSRTADEDCGKGFLCYSAAQSLGGSICVPRCDPNDQTTCPGGVCTAAGACLKRCTVSDGVAGCPEPLLCRRTTISPIEAATGNDGVCLPLTETCSKKDDCSSPVFNACTSDTTAATQGTGLLTTGEMCVQGGCRAANVACAPGSACVPNVLPPTVPAPDVCSPICTPYRDRPKDGSSFNECLPGLTCLSDAFPQTDSDACAPGFPGWLCADNLGCTAGGCHGWTDIDPRFDKFKTCGPPCKTDDDCVPYDRGGNPNYISKNICHFGVCQNLGSLFFPMTCLNDNDDCRLDPEAKCVVPPAVDMGAPGMGGGLGAFGGTAGACVHGCNTRDDCKPVEGLLHIPLTCGDINGIKACIPIVPSLTPCADDGDCYGGMTCEAGATGRKVCSARCSTSADCAKQKALGTNFGCAAGVCLPRIPSGDQAPNADACLSGHIAQATSTCVSPSGWACTADAQCENGQCNKIPRTDPPFGRCN